MYRSSSKSIVISDPKHEQTEVEKFPKGHTSSYDFELQMDIYWPHAKFFSNLSLTTSGNKISQVPHEVAKSKSYTPRHAEELSWKYALLSLDPHSMIIQLHFWLLTLHLLYFPILFLWLALSFHFIEFGFISVLKILLELK